MAHQDLESVQRAVAGDRSAFEELYDYRVYIAVSVIALMTVVNLRGVKESGRVFASLAGEEEIVEYDRSATEVQRFKVGVNPTEMIVKGDRLVVAMDESKLETAPRYERRAGREREPAASPPTPGTPPAPADRR